MNKKTVTDSIVTPRSCDSVIKNSVMVLPCVVMLSNNLKVLRVSMMTFFGNVNPGTKQEVKA